MFKTKILLVLFWTCIVTIVLFVWTRNYVHFSLALAVFVWTRCIERVISKNSKKTTNMTTKETKWFEITHKLLFVQLDTWRLIFAVIIKLPSAPTGETKSEIIVYYSNWLSSKELKWKSSVCVCVWVCARQCSPFQFCFGSTNEGIAD